MLTVVISLSPTEAEMREDAALMAHLSGRAPEPSLGVHGRAARMRGLALPGPGAGSGRASKAGR